MRERRARPVAKIQSCRNECASGNSDVEGDKEDCRKGSQQEDAKPNRCEEDQKSARRQTGNPVTPRLANVFPCLSRPQRKQRKHIQNKADEEDGRKLINGYPAFPNFL